ncbi:MAG: fibronectin type III domain-containing protein [Flavisolibacter sp.]|nr:fibronectin type III domain-containing protein [Flavisolibacter sp.]
MKRIKFEFRRYADGVLLVFSKSVVAALTGNAFFPSLSPSLATVQTAINAYDDSLAAAKEGGKANIAAKNARKAELVDVLTNLGLDVMKTCDGNEEMLGTCGFPLIKTPQPQPPLGTPVISKIELGQSTGELLVVIKTLKGARGYVIEYTEDPLGDDAVWHSQNSTTLKTLLSGLVSGKKYWIRVVAYGKGDQVMVSDPALSRLVQ